jgi:hypothetical protein
MNPIAPVVHRPSHAQTRMSTMTENGRNDTHFHFGTISSVAVDDDTFKLISENSSTFPETGTSKSEPNHLTFPTDALNAGDTSKSSTLWTSEKDDGVENLVKEICVFSGPNETLLDTKEHSQKTKSEQESDQNDEIENEMIQTDEPVPARPISDCNITTFTPVLSDEWEEEDQCDAMRKTPRRSILCKERDLSSMSKTGRRGYKRRRRVSFSNVEIRRYPMILGDNPATPSGPPLSLGWEYEVLPAMNVTDFESFRLRSRRFKSNHLILSHYARAEIVERVRPFYL